MTSGGTRLNLLSGLTVKVGFPLLIGLITLVAARIGGVSGDNSLALAAVVAFGLALILFIADTEARISAVDRRMAESFAKIGRLAELSGMLERSVLGSGLLMDFVQTASGVNDQVNPLLQRLARREIERVTSFMRPLPVGSEIAYDGEDRDWMLGLTREAAHTIDAISLSTVDAGMRGFDGGLWTSDLGTRYLQLQREAIDRGVRIRRIFVLENDELANHETFLKIFDMQREVKITVRKLDHQTIPDWMRSMIFDFILFDGAISYETTPATSFGAQTRPAFVRTVLAPSANRVEELQKKFELLWEAADPDRPFDK